MREQIRPESRTPGRPREFEEQETLETIMDVFWAKGFEGTTLMDLVNATGLKKGSLYTSFGDKHAMYIKALENYSTLAVDGICDYLNGPGEPSDKIKGYLYAAIDAVENHMDLRGCFLCNAAADQAATDPEVSEIVKNGFNQMERTVAKQLSALNVSENIESNAGLIVACYSGLRLMARSGMDIEHMKSIVNTTISRYN